MSKGGSCGQCIAIQYGIAWLQVKREPEGEVGVKGSGSGQRRDSRRLTWAQSCVWRYLSRR